MARDLHNEIDELQLQMTELRQLVQQLVTVRTAAVQPAALHTIVQESDNGQDGSGAVFYSGQAAWGGEAMRWEPQERRVTELLKLHADKSAKVLAALGHRQRLEILRAVLREPLTGAELVERLGMGTTGQLYHHLKALSGVNLLVQEQSGRYAVPSQLRLPFLLLLAAAGDLLDAGGAPDTAEPRSNPGVYFGAAKEYDAHHLLWAVIGNSVLEHQAGFCTRIGIFLHDDGSLTVADNGRGIPVSELPGTGVPRVQSVLTDIHSLSGDAPYRIPGAGQEISVAVVNALCEQLTVEIRREGKVFRQSYRNGIPTGGLMTVGLSQETGTAVTLKPDPELFASGFERHRLNEHQAALAGSCPGLEIVIE